MNLKEAAFAAKKGGWIYHPTSDRHYQIVGPVKVQIDHDWIDGICYRDPLGDQLYTRLLTDCEKLVYKPE